MNVYRHFAQVYDAFMADIPYEQWAGYIDEVLRSYGVPPGGLVLDLACGTGTMAFLMVQNGYELIGVDVSADMLSEATAKMYEKGLHILFLNQDMRALDLYGTVDAVYSSCDGLNYLLTEADFEKVLTNVALYLNPGGIFVFDLKTDSKYRQLGDNIYYDNIGIASYQWKNHYNPDTNINEYQVQFFFQQEGQDKESISFLETHYQRAYSTEKVIDLVKKSGFKALSIFDNYAYNPARSDSERLTYVARK